MTLSEPLSEGIGFATLKRRVLARRWWFASCVFVCTAVMVIVAYTMRPVYRVTAVLAVASSDRSDSILSAAAGSLGGLASGLGLSGRDSDADEAVAVLQSRELTEQFIVDNHLLPELFQKQWDAARSQWLHPDKPPTLAAAFHLFDESIRTVVRDKRTSLITMTVDWYDRAEAARWANDLLGRLNEEMRRRAIDKANRALGYLNEELADATTVESRSAVGRLMEAQIKQRTLARVSQDFSLRFVDHPIGSDQEKPLRPKKRVLAAIGLLAGILLGLALTFFMGPLPGARESRTA